MVPDCRWCQVRHAKHKRITARRALDLFQALEHWLGQHRLMENPCALHCCASGSRFGELEALGYDWKAARDARIAAGGAW